MSSIHSYLKEARIDKELTQEEVADRIGLTRQAVSAYESGQRQPGIDILMKLAEVYEVSIENLLYGKKGLIEKRRVKRIAVFVASVFLLLQILTGIFSVLSFVLYPVEEGVVSADQMEVVEKHFEMGKISENIERVAASMLWFGSLIAVSYDLVKKPAFSWKRKVGFYLIALGISWGIAVLLGIIHPAFSIVDFVIRGPLHFAGVTILLVVDLVLLNLHRRANI